MFTSKSRKKGDVCAIFVHAGAGYHSIANEHVHLQACNDACQAAMGVLLSGGTAVDAVELAIKVLEDREITNAGYGSNLSMDGVVECDALVVDHLGRSGGVGAIAQVKNPISVARLLLDHSAQPLSLRRVPPNLLVGQGATDFAYEYGIPVLPYDALVSPAARDRWLRWRRDLRSADRKLRKQSTINSPSMMKDTYPEPLTKDIETNREREAHAIRLLRKYSDKPGASHSPSPSKSSTYSSRSAQSITVSESSATSPGRSSDCLDQDIYIDPAGLPGSVHESSRSALINSSQNIPTLAGLSQAGTVGAITCSVESPYSEPMDTDPPNAAWQVRHTRDGSGGGEEDDESSNVSSSTSTLQLPSLTPSPPPTNAAESLAAASEVPIPPTPMEKQESPSPVAATPLHHVPEHPPLPPSPDFFSLSSNDGSMKDRCDNITDTVGAIAIDKHGYIACGASSGGIGMKYRGRVGPAALVGVGAAVIPVHPDDSNKTCISSVTSGTGEHMGTTLAANVCAERLYNGLQKSKSGKLDQAEDDEVLRAFIERDFMTHPSVKNSHSAGAIGVLSVKKTKDGVYLYFAHNTDSFALASMTSEDDVPKCTMSRNKSNGSVAQGGRATRYRRKKN